jgi:nitrite reductase/ring-hydroxylating ferredoxin subunit
MTIQKSFYTIHRFLTVAFLLFCFSCKKEGSDDKIPYVPVSFTVYLSLPQYASLNTPGNNAIVTGVGYRGIIVYRKSNEEFVSYDLACPFDPMETSAKLEVDSSGITMVDLHCGSKFGLIDGSILHGPSTRPMRSYATSYDPGQNAVSITN